MQLPVRLRLQGDAEIRRMLFTIRSQVSNIASRLFVANPSKASDIADDQVAAGKREAKLLADYVRATLDDGAGNVPRIPPYDIGGGLMGMEKVFAKRRLVHVRDATKRATNRVNPSRQRS
jgi:hypothetical protein